MAWSLPKVMRSYPCNPELLKFLRGRKRWSQKQLAKEAGYSERLICKAESGGSVSSEAIDVLATSLSSKDMIVYPEDLISDPVALSKKFIEAVHTLQRDMVKGIIPFTNPSELSYVQYANGGNQSCRGIAAVNIAVGKIFDAQEFVAGQDFRSSYKYYAEGKAVVAWGTSAFRDKKTGETFDIKITLRLIYEKGRLCRIEDRSEVRSDPTD